MDKKQSDRFHIRDYRSRGQEMEIIYHCPTCLQVYTRGNFTIESDSGFVIGRVIRAVCCEKEHPTPRIFATLEEADRFLRDPPKTPHTRILRTALESSQINMRAIAKMNEERKKRAH